MRTYESVCGSRPGASLGFPPVHTGAESFEGDDMGGSGRRGRRLGLAAALVVLTQGLYAAPPAIAASSVAGRVWTPPNTRVSTVTAVPGSHLHPAGSTAAPDHGGRAYRAPKVTLPAAGGVD